MSIYRTYFTKNNTIVKGNHMNFGHNPITEISYGYTNNISRFLFDIDIQSLREYMNKNGYNNNSIVSHKLVLYNTINQVDSTPFFADKTTQRCSSFNLELYSVSEDWDEGNGYKFYYDENSLYKTVVGYNNWYKANTTDNWNTEGVVGVGNIPISIQSFENGGENVEMDITNYINSILINNSNHNGFILKFSDEFEALSTSLRQAVAFHTKYTHTFFEPHIETTFNDSVFEDRNNFYMDEDNQLYFIYNDKFKNVVVNSVDIYDNNDALVSTITNIDTISNNIFKIDYNVSSVNTPDMVMFNDVWNINIDGVNKEVTQKFVIKEKNNVFSKRSILDPNNYNVLISGVKSNEKITYKSNRLINFDIRKMYHDDVDVELYINLYIKLSNENIIPIITLDRVNKKSNIFWYNLDMEWLKPHNYIMDVIISDKKYDYKINSVNFQILR